ncbi:MAG: DUF4329 domain-containing protein [Steroidobacteraceae bacterium]|jgi:hypothetical protein
MASPKTPDKSRGQPKGSDQFAIHLEDFAFELLNQVLAKSISNVPRPAEYGGVIYLNETSRQLGSMGPFKGPPGEYTVDIHWRDPNMGCPVGTKPKGWYHTHPSARFGEFHFLAKAFVDNDKDISDEEQIPGFLGVYDGTFWRYDPPPYEPTVLTDHGLITQMGPGKFTQLNRRLKITTESSSKTGIKWAPKR